MVRRPRLDPEELRAYAKRDWAAPARLAARRRVEQSIDIKVRLSIQLYEAARTTRPDWPSEEDRQLDRRTHERVRALLDRAAHVRAR